MISSQDDGHSEFISPFLKSDVDEEIVTVAPQEPGKNNRKVYLIRKEAGLTGRSYLQCSACRHRAFKLFRNVTQSLAPDHLKRYGSWENEVLRFCRTCWYGGEGLKHGEERLESRPHFDRGPLGVTDQRACVGWHFLQRDFVRKRRSDKGEPRAAGKEANSKGNNEVMLPLVSVVGQRGNEFVKKDYNANLFDLNGNEVSQRNNESGYLSVEHSPSSEEKDRVSSILINIQKDHDYAPAVQREVEVTTSGRSPVKDYYNFHHGNNLKNLNSKFDAKNNARDNKRAYKVKYGKEQVKQAANKLLKKAVMFEGTSKQVHNFVTVNLPVAKVEEELRSKREKGEGPDPNHLMGLKARADDGQTLPGLICPLCGKHTVKSYSVWKKSNAPAKIMHLFKDGVTIIRACRKCVPYPLSREREKRKVERNDCTSRAGSVPANASKSSQLVNSGKPLVNGYTKRTASGKNSTLELKGSVEAVKNSSGAARISSAVKETVGTKKVGEGPVKQKRSVEEVETDNLRKKAKIEEKKRTLEKVSGQELTGLECFESLQSEERIDGARGEDAESFLLCNEVRRDLDLAQDAENEVRITRGRSSKTVSACDKCSSPLGKTHRTIKLGQCPKKFSYFFKENRSRRSMKICKNCSK